MNPRPVFAAAALALLAARPVSAEIRAQDSIATTDAFLPAVHVIGATGVFRTDVNIFNPQQTPTSVTLYFTREGTDGTNVQGLKITPDLFARETVTLTDIVKSYLGLDNAFGVLEVRASAEVIVTSNTYNVAGAVPGTYGQFSPGQPGRAALGFDDSDFGDLYVAGVPNDSDHRTNAVIINPSNEPLEAGVQLVDAAGQIYGTRIYGGNDAVKPYSMKQLNDVFGAVFADFHPPAGGAVYRLNFFVNLGNGAKVLSYVTVTDKRTGDPYLIPGQAMRP